MESFTLASVLRKPRTAQAVNDARVAVRFGDQSLTYEGLDERSNLLAAGLFDAGFRHGDRLGILMRNRTEWVELFFAVAKVGGVIVPINYLLMAKEIEFILRDAGVTALVSEAELFPTALQATPDDSGIRQIIVGARSDVEREGLAGDALAYGDLLASDAEIPSVPVAADDLFLLQYTSGTTGTPKGAMHTHSTVLWNTFHQILDFGVTSDDVYLVTPALCWAAGFHDIALAALWVGGQVLLNPSTGFDPDELLQTVERERVTKVLLVPSVLKRVLAAPTFETADLSSLRAVYSGGEPVPVTAIEEFTKRLPTCALVQAYGMSEFPTMMLYLSEEHAISKIGSAGRAARAADIRVVDSDGRDVPAGESGQIVVRSPACMVGYFGRDEATNETIVDGWMHTGDLATVDEDGFVYIKGRSKDMMISGGLNVYPAEVEAAIAGHPSVVEAAVVGVPDERWGEVGHAFVTLCDEGTIESSELAEWLRDEIAHYKIPHRFTFGTDPLPRTTSGKVQKFKLATGRDSSNCPSDGGK